VFEDERGKMEVADLNPNLLPVFGGNGGGISSEFVLPVSCLAAAALSAYFCLMKRSIAASASSASMGMGGLVFWGL
jgi:hypothetical protein